MNRSARPIRAHTYARCAKSKTATRAYQAQKYACGNLLQLPRDESGANTHQRMLFLHTTMASYNLPCSHVQTHSQGRETKFMQERNHTTQHRQGCRRSCNKRRCLQGAQQLRKYDARSRHNPNPHQQPPKPEPQQTTTAGSKPATSQMSAAGAPPDRTSHTCKQTNQG
jgi:hypothetical protein